jgi:hypothetical protein
MAKVKIAGVEVDIDAHKGNTEAQQEAIFAHLPYYKRKEAVRQLQEAFKAPAKVEPPKEISK